jgi:hypothetical protein
VSSAVLYLAIVAIWALVLVPRWVRPRHSAPRTLASQQTLESQLTEPAWPRRVEDFAWADEDEAAEEGEARQDRDAGPDRQARPDGDNVQAAAGHGGRTGADRVPSATGERASILRARRRALIALLLLTGGAVVIAVRHLAAYWVMIPPGVLLAGFMLLLREASRSDARRARETFARRHATGAEGRPSPAVTSGGTGQQKPATEPGAQIIDISARVGDQLYDQYADAEIRAVGD